MKFIINLAVGLVTLSSISAYAGSENCLVKLDADDSVRETALNLLKSKGYNQAEDSTLYFSARMGSVNINFEPNTPRFIENIAYLIEGPGGYAFEHNLGTQIAHKKKKYNFKRYYNKANVNLALSSFINATVPECE